ncbi:PQQ-dependent sugar dehydrogenase [Hymenobacter sp. BT186]|uniref:PQQ-dependent sugar dehydrogenase n=1 Tax=Hymenobacter telluris TaxID=2816474 RepID=A0A939F0M3_9BACT|nr:PQQ-dependent sugar dehydrogenase [Hymenobacter telluris]MBO0360127.1 PQQ-dependent sugar dehydrogenase [Hymenobacter telluris]MBW3376154.1 PQQ-dependent sugar dehydrogenase [Hymenobacter norwichensis]
MKRSLMYFFGGSLALLSCSQDDDSASEPNLPPVETSAPNTTYKPAFEGQTRISGVMTPANAYKATVITSELTSPWGVTALPDGRLLVTEKAGRLRIVTAAGAVSAPITGIPAVNPAGQGGLLGLCLDPNFASNRMIYWSFSEAISGGNVTAIGKGRLADNEQSIEGATVIYRALPAYSGNLHYGGRVVFDRTGNLVVSTGERSDLQTRPQAQVASSALGKVIRITKDGQPAPGNPTFAQAGARPELYSIGHRNPQGLAIHPTTGDVWQGEHGPKGGDEINRLQAGANYGWPTITYGVEYTGPAIGAGIQQQEGLEQPVYYWDPVVSPSGMTFYTSDRISGWRNNLFIGALSGQHIVRLVIDNNKVVGEERLLASEGQRFRDITQGSDGALYAVTDQGRLYRIDRP